MSGNFKVNQRCLKGNTTYFKIKINEMIEYEINKSGVNQVSYRNFNSVISENFAKFTDKITLGGDFSEAMTSLRDKTISECVEIEKDTSSSMRPFFKDYIFDKIYTMGINIKRGILPDDFEKELEEAKLKIEEETKLKTEEEEKNKNSNEIILTVEDAAEEKPADIVDQMWGYFFGSPKISNSTTEKKPEKQKNDNKDKIKGE